MAKCGFDKKECIKDKCEFWTHLLGKDPQSEGTFDKFGCAMAFLPILLVENAQMSRQTAGAIESYRNEFVKSNGVATSVLGNVLQSAHIKGMSLVPGNNGGGHALTD